MNLLLALIMALTTPCIVRGYLYADGIAPVEVNREDNCPVTLIGRTEQQLLWLSGDRLVLMRVPDQFVRQGWVAFWYRWDSPRVYFSGQAYPVQREDAPVG